MINKKLALRAVLAGTIGMLFLLSCNRKTKNYADNDVIFRDLDQTIKPGDDFFKYANNGWLKRTLSRLPIPHGELAM